jgi:hypothetical protein
MADTDILRELLRRHLLGGPPVDLPAPPRLAARLRNHHLESALVPHLPAALRSEELEADRTVARGRTAWLLLELERVVPPLARAGCRPVVLKGAALAVAHYPDPLDRWFVDLDLLVPRGQVVDACAVLADLGYVPLDGERYESYYDRHHLHRVMVGPSRAVVEIHWDLTIPGSVYDHDPDGVQERAVTVPLGRSTCRVASPADQVIHGVYQHVVDGFGDPRRLLDLAHLVPHLDADGWARVEALAVAGRLQRALGLWLGMARELVGLETPPLAATGALGHHARRLLANLDVAEGLLSFRAQRTPGYARFLHLVLVPGWRRRLAETVRLVLPGDFHLMDAGHDPAAPDNRVRRAAMGLRNARNLSRVLLRALGF